MSYKESRRVFIETANKCGYGGFKDIASIVYGYLEYDEPEYNEFVQNVSIKCFELFGDILDINYDEFYEIMYKILSEHIGMDYYEAIENMNKIIVNTENKNNKYINYCNYINYDDYNIPYTYSKINSVGLRFIPGQYVDYGILNDIFPDIFDNNVSDNNQFVSIPDNQTENKLKNIKNIISNYLSNNEHLTGYPKDDTELFNQSVFFDVLNNINIYLNNINNNIDKSDDDYGKNINYIIMSDLVQKIREEPKRKKHGSKKIADQNFGYLNGRYDISLGKRSDYAYLMIDTNEYIPQSQNVKFDLSHIIKDIIKKYDIVKLNKKYVNKLETLLDEYICIYFDNLFTKRNIIKSNYNWLKILYINSKFSIYDDCSISGMPTLTFLNDYITHNSVYEAKILRFEIHKRYNHIRVLIFNRLVYLKKYNKFKCNISSKNTLKTPKFIHIPDMPKPK